MDAEPDSDFTFAHLLRDLQPGTSYAFRIRAFNGYGPGEYTYKVHLQLHLPVLTPYPYPITTTLILIPTH